LDHLQAVREKFQTITSHFASFQAQWLNVHVDFPLLQRIALPITIGSVRYPGIKIHETRIIRLMEVLLHGGTRHARRRLDGQGDPSTVVPSLSGEECVSEIDSPLVQGQSSPTASPRSPAGEHS
jgi:hypothetical protein